MNATLILLYYIEMEQGHEGIGEKRKSECLTEETSLLPVSSRCLECHVRTELYDVCTRCERGYCQRCYTELPDGELGCPCDEPPLDAYEDDIPEHDDEAGRDERIAERALPTRIQPRIEDDCAICYECSHVVTDEYNFWKPTNCCDSCCAYRCNSCAKTLSMQARPDCKGCRDLHTLRHNVAISLMNEGNHSRPVKRAIFMYRYKYAKHLLNLPKVESEETNVTLCE
jgi:hypothetical protein